MGIDAEMLVKVNKILTQDDIKHESYIFGSAFKDYLMLGFDDKVYHKNLEIVDKYEQDGPDLIPEKGTTFIRVPLSGRYYGEGYERGPLMIYIIMAEFLEKLFPSCEIFYGGDSSGICAEPFDKKNRDKLMQYYIDNNGRDKYNNYFSGNHGKYKCPNCDMPMNQNGWKGKLGYYTCSGCGWNVNEISETEVKQGFDLKFL